MGHSVEACTELMISPLTRKSEIKYIHRSGNPWSITSPTKSPTATHIMYVKAMNALAQTFADYYYVDTNEYPDNMPRAMGLESDEAGEIRGEFPVCSSPCFFVPTNSIRTIIICTCTCLDLSMVVWSPFRDNSSPDWLRPWSSLAQPFPSHEA